MHMSKAVFFKASIAFWATCLGFFVPENLDVLCSYIVLDVALMQILCFDKKHPVNLVYIFISCIAVFHFGQVILYVLGITPNTDYAFHLFGMFDDEILYKTLKFCVHCYNGFCLTGFFAGMTPGFFEVVRNDAEKKLVYDFGRKLFCILLIPILLYDFVLLFLARSMGYAAKYALSNGFFSTVDSFFPMAIICIFAGSNTKKDWKYFYIFALVRLSLQMLLVGNRGPLMMNLLEYELARAVFTTKSTRKWSLKQVLFLMIVALAVSIAMSYVVVLRSGRRVGISEFFLQYNVLSMFFSEFGSTLITPLLTHKYIAVNGLLNGKSFLGGLAILLPLSSVYLGNVRSYANIGVILNPYAPARALGGSILAELYLNFSNWGIIGAYIFGILIAKVSKYITYSKSLFGQCVLVFISCGFMWYVRGSAQEFILALKRGIYIWLMFFLYKKLLPVRGRT